MRQRLSFRFWPMIMGAWLLLNPAPAGAPAAAGPPPDRGSVHVILSGEFFEALSRLERTSGVTYGDRQEALLEKIALSCQYLVKTNLTLIEQQERLLRLLEGQAKARGQER
jgi:hypothetical protein